MKNGSMGARGERLYARLLSLYPRSFRDAHRDELLAFFRALSQEPRHRGWPGRARLWTRIGIDLVRSVSREIVAARAASASARAGKGNMNGEAGMFGSWVREDVRVALRSVVRSPGFALATVLTLSLGIGATTTMFGVVDGILLRSLAYPDAERLVQIGTVYGQYASSANSPPDFYDVQVRVGTMSSVAASRLTLLDVVGTGEPSRVSAAGVSASFFDVVGVQPERGRAFDRGDDRIGAQAVTVLSHGLWQRRFGGNRDALGRTLVLDDVPYTIVGVMPAGFRGPEALHQGDVELWIPLGRIDDPLDNRDEAFLQMIGRLAPSATIEQARAELSAIGTAIGRENPEFGERRFWVENLRERTVADSGRLLWLLFGAVALLLLIACANVAHLFLVRATERSQEMAVRAAIGAGRLRILRQLLTESTLLALLGGAAGCALAWAGVSLFRSLGPARMPRLADVTLDGRVLLFALAVSLLTGVVFGLVPAFGTMRSGLSRTLRDGGAATGSRGRQRLRGALIVVQTSLALVLLAGAGLLFHSLLRLSGVDPGFEPDNVVWIDITLPERRYEGIEPKVAFFERLLEDVRARPGVLAAGAIHGRPLDGNQSLTGVLPEGRTLGEGERAPRASWASVMPGYFATLRVPLLAGRDFHSGDDESAAPVVVVSRAFAERHWPGANAVGQRIRMGSLSDDDPWFTVIGVVDDVLHFGLDASAEPMVYRPLAQAPRNWLGLVARGEGRSAIEWVRDLRTAVWALDPMLPLDDYGTMRAALQASIGEPRFRALALSTFSAIAAILAFVGLYATLAWTVRTRRREVGIRMALGAAAGHVQAMVIARGMRLALLGVALGVAGALAASRLLASMVYGITTTDFATFASVAGGMLVISVIACWIPARRAARTDPARTLRVD